MAKNNYEKSAPKAREFYVQTPLGKLHIHAKDPIEDSQNDYPGVYIDYVDKNGNDVPLTVVEYDNVKGQIQTVVYADEDSDDPTDIITYEGMGNDESNA